MTRRSLSACRGQESEEITGAAALLVECRPAESATSITGLASSSPILLEAAVAETEHDAVVVRQGATTVERTSNVCSTQESDPQAIITVASIELKGLQTVQAVVKRANNAYRKHIDDLQELLEMTDSYHSSL